MNSNYRAARKQIFCVPARYPCSRARASLTMTRCTFCRVLILCSNRSVRRQTRPGQVLEKGLRPGLFSKSRKVGYNSPASLMACSSRYRFSFGNLLSVCLSVCLFLCFSVCMLTATANQSPFVQADQGQPVPECPQSGFLLALKMMEVVSGDNWSCKTCKAPVKSSPPTNQQPAFDRPVAEPTVSEQ